MIYTHPTNRFILDVIGNNEYNFLNHYKTVIDIGANVGAFTFWIYDHADLIYSVEPVEENINSLQETIRVNNLKKIVVKQMAISNVVRIQNMLRNMDPKSGGWKLDIAGDYPVDCRTLEDFMDSSDIPFADLVKIDVEGEELKIFQTIGFPKDRIGIIIGEFHTNVDKLELKKTLEWLGFVFYEYPNNHFLARHI
jgi:FkbM family methyltransferase